MKQHTIITLLVSVLSLLLLMSCGQKTRKAGGSMDTPESHYIQGMKYWDLSEYDKAEEEFKLATSLDPKYAKAVAGLALTTAKKSQSAGDKDSEKKLIKEALKLADKAQGLDDDIPEVFIAKGMVITMQYEGKKDPEKWIDDVERQYSKAIKRDPNSSEAFYRRGYCYKKAYYFTKASNDFKKVIEINRRFTQEANRQWQQVQMIERAAPGTVVGKKIALVEKISRADVAALFIQEMKIDKLIKKRRKVVSDDGFEAPKDHRHMEVEKTVSMKAVTDIDNHWAKNFINDIVSLRVRGLEPYPNHTFKPQDLITRSEYALMIEDIIIAILGDQTLATKHIGTESRFPDVRASHPAYNAICNAVDNNVMDAEMGRFSPTRNVSGAEALLVIRKLHNLNKID